jgi:hypothetical protein
MKPLISDAKLAVSAAALAAVAFAGTAALAGSGFCDHTQYVIHVVLTDVVKDTGSGAYESKDGALTGKWEATSIEQYGVVSNSTLWPKSGDKAVALPEGADKCGLKFKFDVLLDTDKATATNGSTQKQQLYSDFGGVVKGAHAEAVFIPKDWDHPYTSAQTAAAEKDKHLLLTVEDDQYLSGDILIRDPQRKDAEPLRIPVTVGGK